MEGSGNQVDKHVRCVSDLRLLYTGLLFAIQVQGPCDGARIRRGHGHADSQPPR